MEVSSLLPLWGNFAGTSRIPLTLTLSTHVGERGFCGPVLGVAGGYAKVSIIGELCVTNFRGEENPIPTFPSRLGKGPESLPNGRFGSYAKVSIMGNFA